MNELTINPPQYSLAKWKTKKVNFMVRNDLVKELENLVPAGKRSQFVNTALEQALTDYSRRKGAELMDKASERDKLAMTTEEILEAVRFGRK